MSRGPEISIITVNFNGLKDTCELIESIQKHVSLSYELIVVDNASAQNETIRIKEHYPEIICIRNEINLGFSGGNNLGIKIAKGKYILLLNNDTLVKDDSFRYLVDRLESDPLIAGVSPKIKFADSPDKIQYAGYSALSSVTLRNHPIGFGEKDQEQFNVPTPTPYLHGAAMMLKREIIQQVGLMPEIYFLYYEELDWCTQINNHGYLLYYEPECTIFHKESQSTGQNSPLKIFYLSRNRLLYAFRNRKGILKYLSLAYQFFIAFPKNSLIFILKGQRDLVKSYFSGLYSFIVLKNKTK